MKLLILLVFTPAFLNAQIINKLSSEELFVAYNKFLNDSTVIIDARSIEMYKSGHINNAINIDAFSNNVEKRLLEFLDKKIIVVYCTTNNRSLKLIEILKKNKFKGDIIFITDGISGWKENGFELDTIQHNPIENKEKVEELLKPSEKPMRQEKLSVFRYVYPTYQFKNMLFFHAYPIDCSQMSFYIQFDLLLQRSQNILDNARINVYSYAPKTDFDFIKRVTIKTNELKNTIYEKA